MLHLLGFGEHSGNGVPDIFEAWNTARLKEPVIEEHFGEDGPNKTIVTLPLERKDLVLYEKGPEKRPESKSDEIEERIRVVFELIRNDPTISRAEIGRRLEISDKQVKLAVENLKEKKKIHREGSARSGKWIIDV